MATFISCGCEEAFVLSFMDGFARYCCGLRFCMQAPIDSASGAGIWPRFATVLQIEAKRDQRLPVPNPLRKEAWPFCLMTRPIATPCRRMRYSAGSLVTLGLAILKAWD